MSARVTKKALLLLATSLLLAGCTDNPGETTESGASGDEANTSIVDNSGNSDASYTSGESSSKSSIDYTQGWDPAVDEQIRRSLGGNGLPFFDMTGEITIVHIDKTETSDAHILMRSTCAYDEHLVYRAKTQFGLAGWVVSYNNAAKPRDMRLDAVQNETGISLTMSAKVDARGECTPYIEIYYREMWNEPAKGTSWSASTLSVLNEIGVVKPHMLPYLYLATYNDTAAKVSTRKATIKGGDWLSYEKNVVLIARTKAFTSGNHWSETNGKVSTYGHYGSNTYTFTKTFSDGYTITAKLYGDAADGSFSSTSADDVVCYLDVSLSVPRN